MRSSRTASQPTAWSERPRSGYLIGALAPQLRHGDSVVMDNLAAHKDERVRAAIKATGALAVYQPPNSPDLNPIELAWAWLKDFLRNLRVNHGETPRSQKVVSRA